MMIKMKKQSRRERGENSLFFLRDIEKRLSTLNHLGDELLCWADILEIEETDFQEGMA